MFIFPGGRNRKGIPMEKCHRCLVLDGSCIFCLNSTIQSLSSRYHQTSIAAMTCSFPSDYAQKPHIQDGSYYTHQITKSPPPTTSTLSNPTITLPPLPLLPNPPQHPLPSAIPNSHKRIHRLPPPNQLISPLNLILDPQPRPQHTHSHPNTPLPLPNPFPPPPLALSFAHPNHPPHQPRPNHAN